MSEHWKDAIAVLRSPPADAHPPTSQANSYREVIALQAILVTLTLALLAYIQRDPTFQARVDLMFILLAAVPVIGLYHIVHGRTKTPDGYIYVYTRPIRAYARHSFFLSLLIVAGASYFYWRGLLPGQ